MPEPRMVSYITFIAAGCSGFGSPYGSALTRAPGASVRAPEIRCAADELSIMNSLSDSYWSSRKARLQAEMEAKLRELDEFQEREQALYAASLPAAPAPAGMLTTGSDSLQAELAAEKERTAALEKELAEAKLEMEMAVQKTAAFWIEKLAEARAGAPVATITAATATAPVAAPGASATGMLLPNSDTSLVDKDLTLRELRLRLLQYGLSTTGLKSELVTRLEAAMRAERLQYKNWDAAALAWK